MKHRGIPSMACIDGALSFHWPFGPPTFSHTQAISKECFSVVGYSRAEYGQFEQFGLLGRLSHLVEGDRSDAALCFFAAFPGQAIHVVRTLVELGGVTINDVAMKVSLEGSARPLCR